MFSPTAKLACVAIGLGGAVTGGVVGTYYLTKKEKEEPVVPKPKEKTKITDLLGQKRLTLLKEEEDGETLKQKWKEFKGEYESQKLQNNWQIDNLTSKDENTVPPEFKKLCQDNSLKEVDNDQETIFTQLVKYCTKKINEGVPG